MVNIQLRFVLNKSCAWYDHGYKQLNTKKPSSFIHKYLYIHNLVHPVSSTLFISNRKYILAQFISIMIKVSVFMLEKKVVNGTCKPIAVSSRLLVQVNNRSEIRRAMMKCLFLAAHTVILRMMMWSWGGGGGDDINGRRIGDLYLVVMVLFVEQPLEITAFAVTEFQWLRMCGRRFHALVEQFLKQARDGAFRHIGEHSQWVIGCHFAVYKKR